VRFYFTRHGETASNKLRVLQGCGINEDLNEVGIEQAECLARQLAGVTFRQVYVSSLKRAVQTANIALQGINHTRQVMDELREWSLGEWEGQPAATYLSHFTGDGEPPGGESRKDFYSRVKTALNLGLKARQPFLIVAHGGVWMVIQDLLKLPRFKIRNCGLVELSQINGLWHQRLLDDEHDVVS
jgi:broad specificity phosphatase PhoE